jgi:hypothetical protein
VQGHVVREQVLHLDHPQHPVCRPLCSGGWTVIGESHMNSICMYVRTGIHNAAIWLGEYDTHLTDVIALNGTEKDRTEQVR